VFLQDGRGRSSWSGFLSDLVSWENAYEFTFRGEERRVGERTRKVLSGRGRPGGGLFQGVA